LLSKALSRDLIGEVRLLTHDAAVQRLELEPARSVRSHLFTSECGAGGIDFHRLAGGFGEQLRMAGPFAGDEPPCGLVDGFTHGEQAVIAQDRSLLSKALAGI
jgi:hypothetical protein